MEGESSFDDFSVEMGEYEVKKTGRFNRSQSVTPGGSVAQIPVISNGILYFGCCNRNVYAVDADTGKEIWRFRTDGIIGVSSPAISDGILYIGSFDHNVYAIRTDNGELVWKFRTSNIVCSSPIVENGTVYIGSTDNFLYAIGAKSGELKWKFRTFGVITSYPGFYNGRVFVGSYDHNFYCIDAETGQLVWKFRTDGEIHVLNPVLIHKGAVFFGSFDNNMYSVDIETGKERWRFRMGLYGNYMSPMLHQGLLYVSSRDGTFHALTVEGKEVWKMRRNHMVGVPLFYENVIFLAGGENFDLTCLDLKGETIWKFSTQEKVWFQPVAWKGRVIIPSYDCHVYSIDMKTGRLVWKFRCEGSPSYLPPPNEVFEVQLKIPAPVLEKNRNYDLHLGDEEESTSTYKSRITYRMSSRYASKGKYQVDSDEESF